MALKPEQWTPREIVEKLDYYIVGQAEAKRAVAVALRNRYRRSQLAAGWQEEVLPNNILMIGPTGVGKTAIARRLAQLMQAPFLKVEATKFTEVGYVGRDVESMVRDLVEIAVRMQQEHKLAAVQPEAEKLADERLLALLVPGNKETKAAANPFAMLFGGAPDKPEDAGEKVEEKTLAAARARMRQKLVAGMLEETQVEMEVEEAAPSLGDFLPGAGGMEQMQDMMQSFMPKRLKPRRLPVREARQILIQQEGRKLVDTDQTNREAVRAAEQLGIIFLDEIDKIAGKGQQGPDISREGVQRDILPIIEGSTVTTKYGPVKTDHMLFIAAGAFHVAKPSDLIPELQGRFPIRVELQDLKAADFVRILTEPQNALLKQYTALLGTEEITLSFTTEAVQEVARLAEHVNRTTENIGARRLVTLLERLLEDLSFEAPEIKLKEVEINASYVQERLAPLAIDRDASHYIL